MNRLSFFLIIAIVLSCNFFINDALSQTPTVEKIVILPGDVPLHLVKIRCGSFFMGSQSSEKDMAPDEAPLHRVTISREFYLGKYEITQSQWKALMGENPSVFHNFNFSGNHPVEMVSWEDAQTFLQKLNELGPGFFRLPTESEWEYCCRAGTQSRFPWSDDPDYKLLSEYAWFYSRAEGKSHPVGQKKPNDWGLYDMHGNVWEWCGDWFDNFSGDPVTDPPGALSGTGRIIRGGSWFNEPEALRSANRHRHPTDSRQTNIGIRIVWIEK